jgi:hypothetical protein
MLSHSKLRSHTQIKSLAQTLAKISPAKISSRSERERAFNAKRVFASSQVIHK